MQFLELDPVRPRGADRRADRARILAFAVDGRPDLGMVVYNPATPADAARIRALLKARTHAAA